MTKSLTSQQRDVLDHFTRHAVFSSAKARSVPGFDECPAESLVKRGVLNKRYTTANGAVYWIRGADEPATGVSAPAGFLVVLHRDVTTPSGKTENFFLARAPYDGRGSTFRRLLRGWMQTLGLRNKDLLGSSMGFELIEPDAAVFHEDHVILDAPHET